MVDRRAVSREPGTHRRRLTVLEFPTVLRGACRSDGAQAAARKTARNCNTRRERASMAGGRVVALFPGG